MRSYLLAAAFAFAVGLNAAAALAQSAVGTWRQLDDKTGEVRSLVTITEDEGVVTGRITKVFPRPGEDPDPVCDKCSGDKHGQSILGMVFIEGMKQSGLEYHDGTILDPESGKVYRANMRLSPDGNTLTVRGFVGISLFGRGQTWTRAP
jgi:uncharacterized protein (DUF2147 family)